MSVTLLLRMIASSLCLVIPITLAAVVQRETVLRETVLQKELDSIDTELNQLIHELNQERDHLMNLEISSQPEMRTHLNEFVNHAEESSDETKRIHELKVRIHLLNEHRDALLKAQPKESLI